MAPTDAPNEKQLEFAPSGTYPQLSCNGRHCSECGHCRDWYYNGDPNTFEIVRRNRFKDETYWAQGKQKYFRKRKGATCTIPIFTHHTPPDPSSVDSSTRPFRTSASHVTADVIAAPFTIGARLFTGPVVAPIGTRLFIAPVVATIAEDAYGLDSVNSSRDRHMFCLCDDNDQEWSIRYR
ncbi:unnamed protein product [Rotaria sordida]|uniref:Uncharacterized protein n=1 Tax=Rotaria sordida TaxID=392033 RepID=A0A815A8X2_9BILA|nr:unnamed protein product [Rotaria sordida]CAF1252753.1 unnamed protein product [Rotaria sordida]